MPGANMINTFMTTTHELKKIKADPAQLQQIMSTTAFLPTDAILRQRLWHVNQKVYAVPTCVCGAQLRWNVKDQTYRRFCSSKCANNSDTVKNKREDTCVGRYGAKSNLSTEQNKRKQRDTVRARYGVDNFAQSTAFKEKYQQTCISRYGVTNASKLETVQEKIDSTHQQRYNRKRRSQVHLDQTIIDTKNDKQLMHHWYHELKMPVTEIAQRLGVNHSQLCHHFKNNLGIDVIRHQVSSIERQVQEYLTELGITYEVSNRTLIGPKELDIYVPDAKIAFELHGLAWHCERRGKSKTYHLDKLAACTKQGIRLVQITDHEWLTQQPIVKSRIAQFLGKNKTIGARKCTVSKISPAAANIFFDDNHIQGSCVAKVCYGLHYNNQLIAAMSFGKSRFSKKFQWELLRYASARGISAAGGASRLFRKFILDESPSSVVSYCDLRWNTGDLYRAIGFLLSSQSGPNYWYTNKYVTFEHRMRYQKHKLHKLLDNYDPALTEWENMARAGYDRFWDCGNLVFCYQLAH